MVLELEFIVDTEGLQLDEVLPLSDLLELEVLFEETLDFEMVVVASPSGFTKIVASDTEPTSQPINTIWINTITFNFYVLYNDGDSTQWVGFPGNTTGVSSKNYWEGTQSQYDALGTYNDNTLYFITT